jgi:hypothetical protein
VGICKSVCKQVKFGAIISFIICPSICCL